jgi:hypothetical protein
MGEGGGGGTGTGVSRSPMLTSKGPTVVSVETQPSESVQDPGGVSVLISSRWPDGSYT